jgi:hypothetical protein
LEVGVGDLCGVHATAVRDHVLVEAHVAEARVALVHVGLVVVVDEDGGVDLGVGEERVARSTTPLRSVPTTTRLRRRAPAVNMLGVGVGLSVLIGDTDRGRKGYRLVWCNVVVELPPVRHIRENGSERAAT